MPHDMNGVLVEPGDKVMIPAEVIEVYPAENFCNAKLRIADMPTDEGSRPEFLSAINTQQFEVTIKASAEQEAILQFFEYAHLPPHLQAMSKPFGLLAQSIVSLLPRNPERTVALRKLLEAKDAAVRARIAK